MEKKRKIVPPVYFFTALVSIIVLHFQYPMGSYVDGPLQYGGVVLASFGLGMAIMSVGVFKKVNTGIVPFDEASYLVTGGFYKYTRNPMYLGMVMFLLGASIISGSVSTLFPIPFFIWVIHANFILGEERFMEEAFGEQYLEFKRRVRRWI